MILLFVNHNSDLYGASRSLLRMASRLIADRHTVHVVLPAPGPLHEKLTLAGATCHIMKGLAVVDRSSFKSCLGLISLFLRIVASPIKLMLLFRKVRPDIVHTNVSVIVSTGLATRLAGSIHILHVREFYDEFKWLWRLYRRYLVATSDRIVCVSSAVARQFHDNGAVTIIHNGFPREEFVLPDQGRIERFRRHVGAPPDCLLVGLPGRIKLIRKGQEVFIEAASLLRDKHADVRYVIIGEPFPGNEHHEQELREQVRRLELGGQVIFVGGWQDMPAAYASLDLVVLASGQPEPFGGVVIEAMAMGKPVIGTRIGGTPEQIEHDVTGLLVPPNDAQALAQAMERLLADRQLRENMGKAGRELYEARFDYDIFYAKLTELYAQTRRHLNRA